MPSWNLGVLRLLLTVQAAGPMELVGACTPKLPRKRIQLQTATLLR
jgi:hypothetical protein